MTDEETGVIFISYAFEDRTHFDNVADQLDVAGLEYWKTGETRAGETLARQLQDAISRASLCIFIATRNSVASSWCSAELGAFWGARKRVLIYLADPGLDESDLPGQFRGHFLQGRIKSLVDDCRDYLASEETEPDDESSAHLRLRDITRSELATLIEDAIYRSSSNSLTRAAFEDLVATVPPAGTETIDAQQQALLSSSLTRFLGLPKSSIEERAAERWPHAISIETSTGRWQGYAMTAEWQSYNYVHSPCLFFRFDDRLRVTAAALTRWYVELDRGGAAMQGLYAQVGDAELGTLTAES